MRPFSCLSLQFLSRPLDRSTLAAKLSLNHRLGCSQLRVCQRKLGQDELYRLMLRFPVLQVTVAAVNVGWAANFWSIRPPICSSTVWLDSR